MLFGIQTVIETTAFAAICMDSLFSGFIFLQGKGTWDDRVEGNRRENNHSITFLVRIGIWLMG